VKANHVSLATYRRKHPSCNHPLRTTDQIISACKTENYIHRSASAQGSVDREHRGSTRYKDKTPTLSLWKNHTRVRPEANTTQRTTQALRQPRHYVNQGTASNKALSQPRHCANQGTASTKALRQTRHYVNQGIPPIKHLR
jgi:hypothetical protein